MKITSDMVEALRRYMRDNRIESTYDLGAKLKLDPSTVARLLRGETTSVQRHTWAILEPVIAKYERSLGEESSQYKTANDFGPALKQVTANTATRQPVIGIAQAAGWSPAVQPLGDFLSEFGDTVPWEEVEPGCWLLRVEGVSMLPLIANGAILHVDTRRFPRRGELVVARLASEEFPCVKYYDRRDGIVFLLRLSPDPDQRSYRIDTKANDDHILWMYPVTQFRSTPPTRLATSEDFS